MPAELIQPLAEKLSYTFLRKCVETQWVGLMIERGWLKLHETDLLHDPILLLTAYPDHPAARFTREIDLRTQWDYVAFPPLKVAINPEMASMRICVSEAHLLNEDMALDFRLSSWLWGDLPEEYEPGGSATIAL